MFEAATAIRQRRPPAQCPRGLNRQGSLSVALMPLQVEFRQPCGVGLYGGFAGDTPPSKARRGTRRRCQSPVARPPGSFDRRRPHATGWRLASGAPGFRKAPWTWFNQVPRNPLPRHNQRGETPKICDVHGGRSFNACSAAPTCRPDSTARDTTENTVEANGMQELSTDRWHNEIDDMGTGLTRNTTRLLEGLLVSGVEFAPAQNYYIVVNHGQSAMNKRAGEAAPTWVLWQDAETRYLRSKKRWLNTGGRPATLKFDGRKYVGGVGSHLPLTWILKFPPEEWHLHDEASSRLDLLVDEIPPHWVDTPLGTSPLPMALGASGLLPIDWLR